MDDDLLILARGYAQTTGLTLRGVGKKAAVDQLFVRLERGSPCRPQIAARALAWFGAHWPSDLPWPSEIERPIVEEPEMPLEFERDDEQEAERVAEERADALFRQRLEEVARSQRLERQAETEKLREAMDLIEHANPADVFDLEVRKAVEGCDLRSQKVAPPSLAGQTAANMERLGREERARQEAWEREQRARERWVADQEEEKVIHALCGGQSEANQRAIRAAFYAQKARG